jgi:hypothetical protein
MGGCTDGRRILDLDRTTWEGFTMRASSKVEANAASRPPKPHFLKRETTEVVSFGAVTDLTLFSKRGREDADYTRLEPD